ncbi:MAG: flagellar biosynthetic protein FliO [Sphingomonas oligoaromativorans]|jgi:flagellar protein FliO/FliZ
MTITYLLNVLLMLALVAGMAVGTLWLMRKFQPGLSIGGQRDRLVKVVDAVPMGATGGRLAVVEFEGKRILVGISRGRMDVLSEAPIDGAFSRYIDDGDA